MAFPKPEGWDSIIVKFSETPRGSYKEWREARPNQAVVRKLLMQYIENAKLQHCIPQKSYIKSMGLK
jgi:endoglucanase